jgi:iron complex outermembrane receptor protein
MRLFILSFILFYTSLFSSDLDNLLKEYKTTSEKSLQTLDEKLGHVFIYSQKDIQLMQYHKLNDILRELPLLNLNKNKFGVDSLAVAGSRTNISGFYRVFINDHEISSSYTTNSSNSWGNLPLDFIDYLEIYYGESSFSSGNENGIYFIRLYTKKAIKENGSEVNLKVSSKGSTTESITDSKLLGNGWSYLLHLSEENEKDSSIYKNSKLLNDAKRRYAYLDISNENTNINLAYTDLKKDNYIGLALDATPDDGKIVSKDFYVDITRYFLNDNSLKANISFDVNEMNYKESNSSGVYLIPVLDLKNMSSTIPKEVEEDLKFSKLKVGLTKSFEYKNNNFLAGLNFTKKKYETQNVRTINFLNQEKNTTSYTDFNDEQIISLMFQNDYKVKDDLILIANAKFDKYNRTGFLEDIDDELYRVGSIYTPFESFGLKTFYTRSYVPPSFFNVDTSLLNKNLNVQKYKFYTVEGVYTTEKSKFGITYHNVMIDDFIHFDSNVGFLNLPDRIKTSGLIYSYEYFFSDYNKLQLNYFSTTINQNINNSTDGGYIKYMGNYNNFEYFTSLIYRNSYKYLDLHVDSSYDMSLGLSHNFNKNLKVSLKANNIFNDSTKSIYTDSGNNFSLDDYSRITTISLKWMF